MNSVNEKVYKIERRVEVKNKRIVKEMDKCIISVISSCSCGKTFLSWNLEKMISNACYSTSLIGIDDKNSLKYIYGIDDERSINLNDVANKDADDLSIKLSKDRSIYTNINTSDRITPKNVRNIIVKAKALHDVVIIDTGNDIDAIIESINMSNKILFIFDLVEYNINENLKILNEVSNIFNKDDIIIVVNNYVECETFNQLRKLLRSNGIFNIVKISNANDGCVYDFIGTNSVPVERIENLNAEMQEILNLIKARKQGKSLNVVNKISKEFNLFRIAMNAMSKENSKKYLKIFMLFAAIVAILVAIDRFNLIDLISNIQK